MKVVIWIPDERAEEFLRKFVPSGVIDTSWYGRGGDEDFQAMEMLPVAIENVDTHPVGPISSPTA